MNEPSQLNYTQLTTDQGKSNAWVVAIDMKSDCTRKTLSLGGEFGKYQLRGVATNHDSRRKIKTSCVMRISVTVSRN